MHNENGKIKEKKSGGVIRLGISVYCVLKKKVEKQKSSTVIWKAGGTFVW